MGCDEDVEAEATEINAIAVEVESVSIDSITESYETSGRIEFASIVSVTPQVTGEVKEIGVKVGDQVTKGDTLLKIIAKDERTQAEQTIEEAKNANEMAHDTFLNISERYENVKVLFESGAVSQSEHDDLKLQYNKAKSQLDLSKRSLTAANEGYIYLIDRYNVKSPIDGRIKEINGEVGQSSDDNVQILIEGGNGYEINIAVPEKHIGKISEGNTAKVYIQSSDMNVNALVKKTPIDIDPSSGLYPVTLKLNDQTDLRSGQFTHVKLELQTIMDQILIPNISIQYEGSKSFVFRLENEQPVKTYIETGVFSGNFVQVLNGLEKDDKIIVKGQHQVTNTSSIKVNSK